MLNSSSWPVFKGTAEFYSLSTFFGGTGLLVLGCLFDFAPSILFGTWSGRIFTFLVITILSRYLARGGINTARSDLRGRICLITGGASGIGLETARELARMGATVIIGARGDEERRQAAVRQICKGLDSTQSRQVSSMNLDLSSFLSIHTFVQEFLGMHTRLHLLINNAGVMFCPYGLTEDGLETQIGTNHFGHFLLTNLLLDTLIVSKARIVNLSSIAHSWGKKFTYPRQNDAKKYDTTFAYADSK